MKNIIDLFNHRLARLDQSLQTPEGVLDAARRSLLLRAATMGAASLGTATALMAPTDALAQTTTAPTDADVLTFALNLEYLEAEFYLRAATGQGLPDDLITGTGNTGTGTGSNTNTPGTVTGGRQVAFTSEIGRQYANEIAADERAHVAFLRQALRDAGATVIARPAINISSAFDTLFQAAGLGAGFDPYASENNFLLGAFVFEDVGVTAYKGSSALIANKAYLTAAAGILAVEAYHAGLIRTVLYARGADTTGQTGTANLRTATDRIAAARASVDGSPRPGAASNGTSAGTGVFAGNVLAGNNTNIPDDQGVSIGQDPNFPDNDTANITPFDNNAIAFSRTPGQVLNVVYLNTTTTASSGGGFFPNGTNGNVRTSTANP